MTRAKAFYWISLPAEIRLMILDAITQQKNPGWASSASVCKEWQLAIEKRNFHRLTLQVSCLGDFERLIVRQRNLVHHVRLDIELPTYTCQTCKTSWSLPRGGYNGTIISVGVWKPFRVLSTWEPANGLTLELNAYSPSDSDHWFKNYYFGDPDESFMRQPDYSWHDPPHGWVNGQQVTAPPRDAILRLFDRIQLRFREELPRADRVTCLIIRRQLRRCLCPRSLGLILSKLGCLEHLIYEPWRQWVNGFGVINDESRSTSTPLLHALD